MNSTVQISLSALTSVGRVIIMGYIVSTSKNGKQKFITRLQGGSYIVSPSAGKLLTLQARMKKAGCLK
jgi:hypothetical protein